MFSKYFEKLEKQLLKKPKTSKAADSKASKDKGKAAAKKGAASKTRAVPAVDLSALMDDLNKIIPSRLKLDSVKMTDPSGYSPEDIDFIAYHERYRDILAIMDGVVPCELVYGTFHVSPMLDKDNLNEILRKVVQAKKINRFTDDPESASMIPAFIVAYDTEFKLPDLKSILIENYMAMSIDSMSEIDIIVILNKGIVIKDWRDKRSYIALETGKDSFMWFFILMNEYLDVEKQNEFDPRNYVQHGEKYNEY
ncbi:MAG: hypothetical protein JW864_11685 [Spirochaetes bacterium]|nr:hypothetical protein [Spirochaetota bacterium]